MRIGAAGHDSGFQIVFREQPQATNDADRDVVRVAAANGEQNFASNRSDFPLPLPPGPEFATQQRIAGPKQELRIGFPLLIEIFCGVRVLVQHQVGNIGARVPGVIHHQNFQSGSLQTALILNVELVAIHHDPMA